MLLLRLENKEVSVNSRRITQRFPTCLSLAGLENYSYAESILFEKLELFRTHREPWERYMKAKTSWRKK